MKAGLFVALSAVLVLAGCGGGGGSSGSSLSSSSGSSGSSGSGSSGSGGTGSGGTTTTSCTTISTSCTNVVAVTVAAGPGDSFNMPYTSVKVCVHGSTTQCATVNDVLVDTASMGVRLFASQLAGVALTSQMDPNASTNSIGECTAFADGYTWGAVATADVYVGGEVASNIPINVIDDNSSYGPAPSNCQSNGTSENSPSTFGANGVLGVGLFLQDCSDSTCPAIAGYYYSCPSNASSTNPCQATDEGATAQVSNPVGSFSSGDNNGVIVQMPAIPAAGQPSATGYLAFGIGTESNNAVGSGVTILTANSEGVLPTTNFGGTTYQGLVDSGSNGYYFNVGSVSGLPTCTDATDFYCPTSTVTLSAVNEGANGNQSTVSLQVANFDSLSASNYAFDDIGGTPVTSTAGMFDFGMPFFFGRTVYFAIEGKTAASTAGPFVAY